MSGGQPEMCVLAVEPDRDVRSVLAAGLGHRGVRLVEAGSAAQARVVIDEPYEAVILEPELPDGQGGDLVADLLERLPPSRIIVHSSDRRIEGLPAIDKYDLDGLLAILSLDQQEPTPAVALQARRSIGRVHRMWLELCRWDPSLPPDVRPPIAEAVVRAVTDALIRPQPLGWGIDPATDPVAGVFALNVGDVRLALAELVCLREAFTRVVIPTLDDDPVEASRRLHMIIDRAMMAIADTGLEQLRRQAFTDELTGLGNRWSFEQDLAKELSRAERSGATMALAVFDVDHLKQTNDTLGHPAGDELLRRTGRALRRGLRRSDRAYRIGGDEFAAILADSAPISTDELVERLAQAGSPPISAGIASCPPEPPDRLMQVADARLYADRARRRAGVATRA